MRLFFILLCCSTASGQAIFAGKDSSVIKIIDDLPASEPFDTAHAYRKVNSPYVYIISDKDLYDIFGWPIPVKYEEFNFNDYHILGTRSNKGWVWMMRDNKKAFTEIPATAIPGHVGNKPPSKLQIFMGDTIIKTASATSMTQWYVTGHGDCMAHFDYSLFTDNYHPVLLLKERNYWGGCRAGGSRDYTISFSMPPGILYHTKNTILMKKFGY
ncbi:MAG TPA: hypothetical protein VK483_04885 [Chitinophagaceae bacterium]|nr:hypothetical protein [Chitinophagaceae bacterium]